MGEVAQGGGGGGGHKKGKVRGKKLSTRIDMTPMVDLAFLLLTFFMLTTTFAKPKTMVIAVPERPKPDDPPPPEVDEKRVLNIILGEKDRVFWWMGIEEPKVEESDFSKTGIRQVVFDKAKEVTAYEVGRGKDPTKFPIVVLIKPVEKSRYKNLVDILDEMKITQTQIYALVPPTDDDLKLIKEK